MGAYTDLLYDVSITVGNERIALMNFKEPPAALTVGGIIIHNEHRLQIESITHVFSPNKQTINLLCVEI
jgi:hypothetical protein